MQHTDQTLLEELTLDRQTLHRHPEEGWTEFFTTHYICERLEQLGLPCTVGPALVSAEHLLGRDEAKVSAARARALSWGVPETFIDRLDGITGVVCEVDTGRAGPTTVCRFDIDCVCVEETDDPAHIPNRDGFCSLNKGFMHACGHDAHTSVGLAVAAWLAENRESLCGKIRLIFQPAEEGARGAYAMTAAGWVDDADYFIASHVGGLARLGEIFISTGGMLASTKLDIDFTGVASHAGAEPEKGHSALLAGAAASLMIAGIPRHSKGDSRVSIGTFTAGEGRNVTPVHARLQVETRGTVQEVNDYLEAQVKQIVSGVALTYGVESKVTVAGVAKTIAYSESLADTTLELARTIPGVTHVQKDSRPAASEDCTHFMHRVTEKGGQAVHFVFGANHQGHHRKNFDIQPECMVYATRLFAKLVARLNAR